MRTAQVVLMVIMVIISVSLVILTVTRSGTGSTSESYLTQFDITGDVEDTVTIGSISSYDTARYKVGGKKRVCARLSEIMGDIKTNSRQYDFVIIDAENNMTRIPGEAQEGLLVTYIDGVWNCYDETASDTAVCEKMSDIVIVSQDAAGDPFEIRLIDKKSNWTSITCGQLYTNGYRCFLSKEEGEDGSKYEKYVCRRGYYISDVMDYEDMVCVISRDGKTGYETGCTIWLDKDAITIEGASGTIYSDIISIAADPER